MDLQKEEVGFCGLGSMGSEMAGNVLAALQASCDKTLFVWNRDQDKTKPLVEKGATALPSVEEVAARCSVVMVMLANDAALRSVFEAYINAPSRPKGASFVDCSTVAPKLTTELAEKAKAKGVTYLSCQVFGRPDAAKAKQLIVVAAGDPAAKAKCMPLLEAMGKQVMDFGDNPANGTVTKLIGNFFISSLIEMFSEGMTLAKANGVSQQDIADLAGQLMPGPIPTGYAQRIAKGNFEITPQSPGFAMTGGAKDVGHAINLAKDSGMTLQIAEITKGHMDELCRNEDEAKLDWGAVKLAVERAAGQK
ncbi:hypothetical protein WJX73_004735 [Symbiochloris irregularis]|uniref:6-phosphogluconate dehydrogenase n=1 Tax=Symbiochloris irregularis TaxID=706552 RepID=A0AAW1PFA6_9CHLO